MTCFSLHLCWYSNDNSCNYATTIMKRRKSFLSIKLIKIIKLKCKIILVAGTQLQLLTSWILSFLLVLTTLLQYLQLYMKAVSICLHSTWSRMSPFSLAILPHRMHCHFFTTPSITLTMCTKNMLSLARGEGLLSAAPDIRYNHYYYNTCSFLQG